MHKVEVEEARAAGIWVRVSTEDQARGDSPEHHQRRAEAYAEARGWRVVETYRRLKRVARILNERGYRTRKGAKFADTTIRRLLEDGSAKGLRRTNYTQSADSKKAWTLKPESDWVFQATPAIVSEELWETCNRVLNDKQAQWAKRGRPGVHLFAGYAYCACGQKMYVWAQTPKYQCAKCRNKIPIADLEAVYRDQLQHFLLSPEEASAHAAAARDVIVEKEALIEAGTAELKKLQVDEDNLFALHARREIPTDGFGLRYNPIAERRAQLEAEIPRLQAECDIIRIGIADREQALHDTQNLTFRWDDLAKEEKRQIIETITDRIVVGKEEVEITLLHTPQGVSGVGKATQSHGGGLGGARDAAVVGAAARRRLGARVLYQA